MIHVLSFCNAGVCSFFVNRAATLHNAEKVVKSDPCVCIYTRPALWRVHQVAGSRDMQKTGPLDRPAVEVMSDTRKDHLDYCTTNDFINTAKSAPYRPSLYLATGSVTAAILLQQLIYWNHPFYKFMEPCDHPTYKPGDSRHKYRTPYPNKSHRVYPLHPLWPSP